MPRTAIVLVLGVVLCSGCSTKNTMQRPTAPETWSREQQLRDSKLTKSLVVKPGDRNPASY